MGTLAGNYYGGIVKDGLVLMLDAAKKDSYDRLGTTWRDISWNGNNGTLTNFGNQTKWNGDNGGSIVFDGTNDFVTTPNLNLSSYDQITVEVWFRLNNNTPVIVFEDSSNWNTSAGGFGLAPNTDGVNSNSSLCHSAFWQAGSLTARNYSFTCGTQSYSCHVNIFSNIVDSTGRLTYVNGVLLPYSSIGGYPTTTSTTTGNSFRNDSIFLASRAGSGSFLNGNIASFKIYNRKLSGSEILQNYNSTKGRYL